MEIVDLDDLDDDDEEPPKKPSLVKGLIAGVIGAVVLGGAAAGVVFLAPVGDAQCEATAMADGHEIKKTKSFDDIAFVNLEPLVVTLGPNAKADYLRVSISLETTKDGLKTAEHLKPRFRDVLNSYLRAVDEKDLVEPVAMIRLRAQILRRLQLVASPEIVSDVLITDFILN